MTTLGRHPDALTVKLTLGDGAHLVATSANGWAGPVTLHYGPRIGDPVISDVGAVDGDEVSWTLTEAQVEARAAHDFARLEDNGVTLAAGSVITWRGGLGSTATQTIASLTAGPPGPTAVSADADNVATLGSDGLIFVSPADSGAFSDAAVAAFVADTGSSTYASILAGFAATDDPRLFDARTPTAHTHDDRYFTEAEVTSALALKSDTGHGHVINDVTGLQSALDGKQAAGSYAAASHTHGVTDLTATGTKDATTFLRGDNTWAVPAGGGDATVQIGTVTLPESPTEGLSVSVLADSDTVLPEDVTWDSGGEPTVTDRLLITFVWSGDDWVGTYGPPIPAPPGPPDAAPPTAGTLGITVGTVTADGLVTGASDETALDAAPYSFRVDAGTWSAWQSSASYEWAGLTAETEYDFQHRARDASGNITEGTVVTDTTNAESSPSGTLTFQGQQRATADVFGDYTYEAPIGTASADRVVIVALTWRAGANRDPALTINGSAPTLDYSSGSATNGVKFYRATVSSGTTATIVANSGVSYWPSIAVWTTDAAVTLIGASNVEAAGTATSVTVGPVSAEDGGFGIAAFRSNNTAAFTTVWSGTNVTERYDSGGTQAVSGADIDPTGATATVTATFDPSIPTPTKVGLARYGWA